MEDDWIEFYSDRENLENYYEKYHKEDPMILKKISARFTSHVFPGETLVVDMWKEGNTVIVATKTKERGIVVLKGFC